MIDEVDLESKLLFIYDNLYIMYKKNKIKKFEDLNLVTFNLTFQQIINFREQNKYLEE